jgi:hypothetical protein
VRPVTRRRLRFLAGFAAYFAAIWLLWPTPVVYPLKVFVVLLHEISHGLAAVLTGGSLERIVLTPDQGGAAYVRGGNTFIMLSAGYLGSMAWGLLILEAARARLRRQRAATIGLGALILVTALLFVRSLFGFLFSLGFGAALILAGRRLRAPALTKLLTTLGLTSALYAILDIRSDILQRPHLESDAHMLAALTGVPTLVWGVLWVTISLAAGWAMFRRAYRQA